ncbi:transcription factor PosF21 [Pyrus ussuriensis x Pyrus communis]|uniref:Transcription factor PosF21 n=1 Tax=Pyrus ussuriensis x Pyrus communis TaxID=2448454 RepID=A0A5N5HJQ0_9ROSA|nr:transcription factor PosF21 [Pyrus ussuriensis x Pyrus communis]
MEGSDETGSAKQQRPNPAFGSSSFLVPKPNSNLDIPNFNPSQMGFRMSPESSKRPGIPPSHPNNHNSMPFSRPQSGSLPPLSSGSSHTRSMSQPPFFSLDSLPPLSPLTYREPSPPSLSDPNSVDVSMGESVVNSHGASLRSPVNDSTAYWAGDGRPPRRGHRRSNSDVSLGLSAISQPSPQLIPVGRRTSLDESASAKPVQLMSQGSNGNAEGMDERKSGGEVVDDLFNAYMNLENIDQMNLSGNDDKDMDSRASGSKTNGGESSDNEVESGLNGSRNGMLKPASGLPNERREGLKRTASGDVVPNARHCRSISMDSYMENLNFDDEPLKPLPVGQQSPSTSLDGSSAKFSMEFGSGEFNAVELKKIMENDKLAEIALSDPKRAKRILANRQSAARSKERKMRYIIELEHKVQTLQTEATTLSAQFTLLQRDSMGLTSENNELKFRLQSLEQQAQLKDALNEALTGEVQRLKLAAAELGGESHLSNHTQQNAQPQQALMEGSDETGSANKQQRPNPTFGSSSFSVPKPNSNLDIPNFSPSSQMGLPMRQSSPSLSPENSKRPGIPPSHPNNHNSMPFSNVMRPQSRSWQLGTQNLSPGSSHTRSLSQPPFFSLDSLPPLSPLTYRDPSGPSLPDPNSVEVSMEETVVNSHGPSLRSPVADSSAFWAGDGLPPRRGHRRSNSDVPLGFSAVIQSSPQLIPIGRRTSLDGSASGRENSGIGKPNQLMRQGSNGNAEGMDERKSGGEVVDDLFNAYMNLENIDKMNSSGNEDKDLDSRASGSKTNGGESSDNEVESGLNGNGNGRQRPGSGFPSERREGLKRTASGDVVPIRHCRSISMDSYMENLNFDDEPLKPLPLGQQSPSTSLDGNSAKFNMEFGSGEFNAIELRKIMENEKLAEIALSDPKRAKRILANRQSAARSKERKMRYIQELEHKVQTLQTEATTLSAQFTKLQRESVSLTSENNELKFRLQALEQQAQLKDALNEALTGEVQRLKLAAGELGGGEGHLSNRMAQQLSLNQQMLQLQHLNLYQMQQQPQHQAQQNTQPQQFMQQPQQNRPSHHQNGNAAAKPELSQ